MTPNHGFDRRHFICGGTAAALSAIAAIPVSAQPATLPNSDPAALAQFVRQQKLWDETVVDVIFLQSWRLELRPMDYEGRDNFAGDMTRFRASVFAARSQLDGQLQAVASTLNAERQTFLGAFSDRRSRYNDFLTQIGIAPNGPSSERITRSMFVFANFAHAALGLEAVNTARRRSFFWPFC
jgi:hypothetical protein